MGAPRANSTTASVHTLSFCFSLPPSSRISFYHRAFSFQLSLSVFFCYYLWYFGISFLSSRERLLFLFPSVVVLSFSATSSGSPGIRATISYFWCFDYHTVVFRITIHISYSVSFYLEKRWQENGGFTSGRVFIFRPDLSQLHTQSCAERARSFACPPDIL